METEPKNKIIITLKELEALSSRIAKSTEDVRDLRARLAFERQRSVQRRTELEVERAFMNVGADNKQELP